MSFRVSISKIFRTKRKQQQVSVKRKNEQCDLELEKHSRRLLLPYSPELAECVTVFWNSWLRTTAGRASYERSEVTLNPALKEISEAEIDKTLRHELAHLLAYQRSGRKKIAPHGPEWRQACCDLGIPNEKSTHQLPFVRQRQKRKFFYRCPQCEVTLSRVRRPRRQIACLACCRLYAKGRYDKRFRYELITSHQ